MSEKYYGIMPTWQVLTLNPQDLHVQMQTTCGIPLLSLNAESQPDRKIPLFVWCFIGDLVVSIPLPTLMA